MIVTLRSGKELKKNSNKEEQPEKRKREAEIEENMEVETEKEGVEVNSKGGKQKYDQVVPRTTLRYTLHPYCPLINSEKQSWMHNFLSF